MMLDHVNSGGGFLIALLKAQCVLAHSLSVCLTVSWPVGRSLFMSV